MIPASVLCRIKVSHGTLSVKPYWPETDEFLCDGLNGSLGRLLYVIGSSVHLFVRLSIGLSVISSRLHLKFGWLDSS